MATIIGIDPGARSGAIAFLSDESDVHTDWLPYLRDGKKTLLQTNVLRQMINTYAPDDRIAVIEHQHAFPQQGGVTNFTIGYGYGSIMAALQMMDIPIELVSSTVWKKAVGLIKADKDASRLAATRLHPTSYFPLKKDHNRADALLIAHWYWQRSKNGNHAA